MPTTHHVADLRDVYHAVDVVVALDKCDSLFLCYNENTYCLYRTCEYTHTYAVQERGKTQPATMVMGPTGVEILVRVKCRTSARNNVVFPTLRGPTSATSRGGGCSGILSTVGIRSRLALISAVLK